MKNTHRQEYIDCSKLVKTIKTLKDFENPRYQAVQSSEEEYLKRC